KKANGEPRVSDLRKMPHLLVAGTTGSGKSVFITSMITGFLFRHSPKTLRLIVVDPKQVDLAPFYKVPHLCMPPVTDARKAVLALKWAVREMDKRYRSMAKFGSRGLEGFNEVVEKLNSTQKEEHERINQEHEQANNKKEMSYYQQLPYIVIIVEEFADLMVVDKGNVEPAVQRLTQMARACGMHLVLATQSPRKDVVTGIIKTNIPGRISFKVASKMDSRIILDESGAERLLARGDMLFLEPGSAKPERHHAAWLSEGEIGKIAQFWAAQGEPVFDTQVISALEGPGAGGEDGSGDSDFSDGGDGGEDGFDARYDEILAWVSTQKDVSASLLQRRFKLGYPRAARMIEIFEKEQVVGPSNGSKPRQVLVSRL
ncbi:MAG: DNA translocase FtsK, partial [Bdellovibrionales bacterium]|nr:DNA translocase FtsK [Bdellovibrionales bacterium]